MATRAPLPRVGENPRHRVMIVDDSAVVRMIVQRIIDDGERFEVVAQAASVAAALAALERAQIDIILLDVEMPGTDGIAAIPELLARSGNAAILMLSSHCAANAELSVRAMTMGASETLLKPSAAEFAVRFADVLERAMMRIAPARPADVRPTLADHTPAHADGVARPIECLAIAASTGGPHALAGFFGALPRDLAAPILITQHLPDDFIGYFARQISVMTGRPAAIARDGDRIEVGRVLVAPGDAHLALCRIGGTPR
ncbi:MAG: response regulator, partial [Sphingomonadaceae bacterium]|nr:response regulator [Sphingomonadaceae bacterium]